MDHQRDVVHLVVARQVDSIAAVVIDEKEPGEPAIEVLLTLDESDSEDIGLLGDVVVTNGIAGAFLPVTRGRVRLRVLNGSTARMYNLGLADNRTLHVVASDGGLLESPVAANRVQLSHGERVELVVDVTDNAVMLRSYPFPDRAGLGARAASYGVQDTFDVLELRPTGARTTPRPLPEALTTIARLDPATAVRRRHFDLQWYEINDARMAMSRVDFTAALDSTEIWTVENTDHRPHNFHVHGAQFQVLDVDGRPPPAQLAGWKDTVYVPPRTPVRHRCHIPGRDGAV